MDCWKAVGPYVAEKGTHGSAWIKTRRDLRDSMKPDLGRFVYSEALRRLNELYGELEPPITLTRDDIEITLEAQADEA